MNGCEVVLENAFDMCIGKSVNECASLGGVNENGKLRDVNTTKCNNRQSNSEELLKDILYEFTRHTKTVFNALDDAYKKFEKSAYHKVLFETTQPAHFVILLAISTIAFFLYPTPESNQPSKLWNFVHLTSFCIHLGAQIWMTFVSGLALYFALPRHDFGQVQKVLFPKYFLLNSILSLITLVIYLRYHNTELEQPEILLQAAAMSTCFLTELIIRLYLTPPLIRLMTSKTEMEKSVGVGREVGKLDAGELVTSNDYIKVHKAFRKVHMKIAMGNVLTMVCTVIHLHYLSNKICIL